MRSGLDSVNQRTVVPRRRQMSLVVRALLASIVPPGHPLTAGGSVPPLPAVRFLVDAAADERLPARTFYQRTLRVLELLERQARERELA